MQRLPILKHYFKLMHQLSDFKFPRQKSRSIQEIWNKMYMVKCVHSWSCALIINHCETPKEKRVIYWCDELMRPRSPYFHLARQRKLMMIQWEWIVPLSIYINIYLYPNTEFSFSYLNQRVPTPSPSHRNIISPKNFVYHLTLYSLK